MTITVAPLTLENVSLLSNTLEPCYVGDPCYVFPKRSWSKFVDAVYSLPPSDSVIERIVNQRKATFEEDKKKGLYAEKATWENMQEFFKEHASICAEGSSPVQPLLMRIDNGPGFIVSATNYGDGAYPVKFVSKTNIIELKSFGVDAGLFAIIPLSVLSELKAANSKLKSGIVTPSLQLNTISAINSPLKGDLHLNLSTGTLDIITSTMNVDLKDLIPA